MDHEDESNNVESDVPAMHFDDIFKYIGPCNRYFLISYLIVSLCIVSIGLNSIIVVFLFPATDFWCQVDELDEWCVELNLTDIECTGLKSDNRPPDTSSTLLNENQCSQYDFTEYDFSSNASARNTSIYSCKSGYEFDNTEYETSVTQEFGLVCENDYLVPLALSVDYVGVLIGAFVFGNVGDRIGRKQTLVVCIITYVTFNVINLLSQWYWMFVASKTISSIFVQGAYVTTFVFGCEIVGPSKRSLAGTFISIQWSIGYMVASLYAYLIRKWRYLLVASAATDTLICVLIYLLVPESPRWLHAVNKMKKADIILTRACRFSKNPQESLEGSNKICSNNYTKQSAESDEQKTSTVTALDLLKTKKLRMRFIIITFIWFVNALVYYGISLSVVTLGSNEYVANALAGLVEIPALILGLLAIERVGRRLVLSGTMMLAGAACTATSLLSNDTLVATFGMIGKFGITASFTIIYIVAAEVYPTPIRNTAIGASSMIGNIGAIIAPQILFAGVVLEQLPYLIFGALSLVAGLVTMLLPETRGLNLPQTLKESENLGARED